MEDESSSVESVEPIVKSGSSADLTSFDELESLHEADKSQKSKGQKESKKSESKKKAKESDKDLDESESGDEEEEESNLDKEGSDKNGKSNKEKTKQDSKESKNNKDKIVKDDDKQSKLIKVRNGDQDIDLRSDTQFEVKVDGIKQTVPIQELLDNFSGKQNWGKKFNDLDKEKKTFQAERQEIQSGIDKLLDLTKTDKLGAVEYLYNTLGENGRQVIKDLKTEINAAFEAWSQLTPEERAQREIQEEADYHKKRADRYEMDSTKAKQQQDLDTRVQTIQKQHNLDNRQFVARYDELQQLKAQGKLEGEITPELVGHFHIQMEQNEAVENILTEINPELEGREAAFKDLKELWTRDPGLTLAQIKKIAADVYGSEAAKKLAKKIKRSTGGSNITPTPRSTNHEPTFFDELD